MNTSITKKKSIFYGWWVVAGGFVLLFLFAGAGFYSFSIFIKPLEESFGWSRSAISFAMSIYMLVHGVVGPFVGYLIGKYGVKKVLTFFAMGSGAAFISISYTPSLWYFYGAYALLSLMTTGIGFIPVSSVIARWFIKRRGTAMGITMVGLSVGGLVVSPVVGMINSYAGWRTSFVCLGIMVWALALPITLFVIKGSPSDLGLSADGKGSDAIADLPATSEKAVSSPSPEEEGWPLRTAIRSRAFRWIAATFFLAPLAQMGVLQHQVPLIMEVGISQATAATALGITAGLGGLGKLSFGRISELIPFRYSALLCFGLQAFGVFVLLNANSVAMVWVHVLIFGFAMGGVIVLLPMVIGQFFGLVAFGIIMGIISFAQAVGCAVGAYLSGIIYDYFGSYQYALVIYIGFYLSSILTIFLAGKPKTYVPRS